MANPDFSQLWAGYTPEGGLVSDTKEAPMASHPEPSLPSAPSPIASQVQKSVAPSESNDSDINEFIRMHDARKSQEKKEKISVNAPASKAPTRFVQSGASAAPTQERTLGSALSEAGENFFPSVGEALKTTGHALNPLNWGETLGNLKSLAQGAVSKSTGISAGQSPEQQAKNEALVNALIDHYKSVYATSPQKFYEALAKDPASIMMDMSMLLTGGETAAAKLGVSAETAGKLGKAAQWVDPVTGTLKAGTTLARGVTAPLRATAAGTSGLSMDMQKIIRDAATSSDPELKGIYNKYASGSGTPEEALQQMQDAIRQLEKTQIENLKSAKSGLFNKRISLSKINSDLNEIDKSLGTGAASGYRKAKNAVDEARAMINEIANDPSKQTLEHLDALKAQIWDLKNDYSGNSKATSSLNQLYHSISDTLSNPALGGSTEYGNLMKNAQIGMKQIDNVTKQLGAGANASATSSLMKAIKSTKMYGGKDLLESISEVDPSIKYMLAGAAANAKGSGIMRTLTDMALFGGLGAALGHPWATFGGLAASSPSAIAKANYYGAKGADLLHQAGKPAYAAGRLNELNSVGGAPANVSQEDIDAMVRAVIGEAGGEPAEGQAAVAHVILNRLKKGGFGGDSIKDIVTAPHQFEAISRGIADKIDPNSKQYQEVLNKIVLPLLRGELQDVTGGATNFINKELQKQRGMQIPEWASGEGQQIGRHTFYGSEGHADGGRIERASGGKVDGSIERLKNRLIKMAADAKKISDNRTKPLLNAPDEAIVKALDVAQQAI